jgi:SAM-dependent methyltransferase
LAEDGFDAVFNVCYSIGYGTEKDDLAVFKTLHSAVRPGGLVPIDTMHRDSVAALFSRGPRPSERLPDGTLLIEEATFDPISGRVNTTWFWSGPKGQGSKPASLRLYTVTELVHLLQLAGLRCRSAHKGCSTEISKAEGPDMGGRISILAECITV